MNKATKRTIGDLCTIEKGKTGIKKAVPGRYPLVVTAEERASHNEYHFDKPSVIIPLVSSTGHGHASLKRIHYQESKFAVGNILCVVTPIDNQVLNANFLYHYLDVYKEELLVSLMKGMANVTLPIKELAKVEIPLMSIEDQNRWVDLFVKTSINTEQLKSEITQQKTLLSKLRQSILQDAIQGKLTEQWRKENPDVEPASELLKRIQAEKDRLIKDKKIKKQKSLPPITPDEIPFKVPKKWEWCRIDDLVLSMASALRTGPFGSSLQKSEHKPQGVPVWGIESIGHKGAFTHKNKIFVSQEKAEQLKSFHVEGGDIIISRSGTVGELCILPSDVPVGLISTNLMKLSLSKNVILPLFFCYQIKGSPIIQEDLYNFCSGSTRLFLTQTILKKLKFVLPPIKEQKAIVEKVEKLFTYCDELEKQINKTKHDSELLMQSVLKEAFE